MAQQVHIRHDLNRRDQWNGTSHTLCRTEETRLPLEGHTPLPAD